MCSSDLGSAAACSANAHEQEVNFLNITAMLDIMTIILVFLLKTLGESTAAVPQSDDLRLPNSIITTQPAQEGGSYRIEITGEPSYTVDLCLSSPNGDHNHAGLVATAARVVNAIPAVVAAPPGISTTLDLPLITGKGLYAAT